MDHIHPIHKVLPKQERNKGYSFIWDKKFNSQHCSTIKYGSLGWIPISGIVSYPVSLIENSTTSLLWLVKSNNENIIVLDSLKRWVDSIFPKPSQ